MTGLIYKEFVNAKRILIFLGVFLVLVCGMLIFNACDPKTSNDELTVTPIAAAFLLYFLNNIFDEFYFNKDERRIWNTFVSSTPGTMKAQIFAKYCVILIVNLVILFAMYMTDVIVVAVRNDITISTGAAQVIIFCLAMIVEAVIIPFNIRFSAAAGKGVLGGIMALLFTAVGIYLLFGDLSLLMEGDLIETIGEFFTGEGGMWITALIPYVAGGGYYLSYRISVRIYRKAVENYDT